MSKAKRLNSRNEEIQAMLSDGERLKDFYRFTAQNPHINLHDGCQIIINRSKASICFSFEEWNAMGRRVTKYRKGIPYYDSDGYKRFVFDVCDTHGEKRHQRLIYPMKRLLAGLDELNGTAYANAERSDYRKIHSGIAMYLERNGYFTDDEKRNGLIAEGIAFSLYSKTGFPKYNGIQLSGLPYSLNDNAQLFKDIYITTAFLQQEAEEAYIRKQEEVKVIDDIDEKTVSDEVPEPIIKAEPSEPETQVTLYYQRYLDAQKLKPQAVVLMRLGDFYEVLGENAKTVAQELDLTLTGRYVGLPERVPMCGMPYHAMDKHLDKILERHGVLLVDGEEEPKYILSHNEANGITHDSEKAGDDFSEKEDEVSKEILSEEESETNESVEGYEDYDEFYEPNFDDEVILTTEQENLTEKIKSVPNKQEKGIKDRKRKDKFQPTLFDLMEPQEKTAEEAFIERQLKYGSGIEQSKFRIFDKYNENPSATDFAKFLKDEYGTGGHGGWSGDDEMHDGKGIVMSLRGEKGEYLIQVSLKWAEAAVRIADLIDDDNYLSEQEKQGYIAYKAEQNRMREQRAEEEQQKNALINKVILSAPNDRKQRTLDEYAKANKLVGFAEYLKNEYGTANETGETFSATYDAMGVWIYKVGEENDYRNRIYLKWEEFADKVCNLIENDRYIKQIEPQEADESKDESTDLTEILDQSELGGAKMRFKGNVEAIRLVNQLYAENRNPTVDEKKVLAKYVGWGGLAQVFDERNESWKNEYAELKGLLSTEDYERAKGSVLNAHYTSKEVIEGMYRALSRFGVKGNNRILEPAMGTGNFFGYMPQEIAENAKYYGVELDNLTGRIATKLYPQVNVQIRGFEETTFPNNRFDLVVSNVPFGGYTVFDSEYNKYNFLIHDYFIAKGIDKLKPKGLMAVITSKGTMDKLNPSVRKYIADRAELKGAIRLPNNAFKQTANTEVVTDILLFQKRDKPINADTENTEWLATKKTDEGFEINNYYLKHPEMILGRLVKEHGLYGAEDVTVKSDGRSLTDALNEAIAHLSENIYENPEYSPEEETQEIQADYDVKPLCYKAENGKLYMRVGESMVEQEIPKSPKDAYARIKGMIALRKELRHILDLQIEGCSDEVLEREQWKLNSQYDLFIKQYGYINSQTNARLFKDDGDSALLFACENLSEDKTTVTKADIFAKRTIRPYSAVTQTDDSFEALQISKNERGKVDISYIEELTKKDYDTVLSELGDSIFRNPLEVLPNDPYSGFETSEEYLSGNVVRKLQTAQRFAKEYPDKGYEKNVRVLTEVQPKPLTASEISVRIGASWVDKEYYKRFLCELLYIPSYYAYGLELYYNPHDSSWRVDKITNAMRNYKTQRMANYGTGRANVFRLFEDCLNLKATTIYDTIQTDDGEKRVLNQEETIAAREKQNQIKDLFKEWSFHDPDRREELERTYNNLFNQIRLPNYDGSYLKFPEMNPAIELKPHQKNAVHRIITGGNTLLHHVVGAGKTFTICAAAMKLRQYGIAKKPMIAVPNHLVQQWAGEFRTLYPNANILVANKEDLEKRNRQKFVSKVAMGDWDAVIIAQSSFAKIPISPERQINKIREEISRIEESIESQWEESNAPRGAIKNLERIKKNREATLKRLLDDGKKDDVLIFEKLGVDYLFIDEAHAYKNLFLFTKMNNVAGISNAASQRASDLQLKCEYINELHGGDKGVVFATGTPISNSMTEMYTMQTYLGRQTLQELGITFFDGWAADFGETITSLEMAPSGQGYKARTRFAKFTNLPELITLYRSFADVQTSDMVKLDVPEAERKVIMLKPSDTVIELAEEIAERAERINDGGVDPHIDNMLKVTSDGKKLALDPRCFNPMADDEYGSKLNECSKRIFEIWQDTAEQKGTQIVFCDLSTPKKAFGDYEYGNDFDVYNDLKSKLVKMGIPEQEIAYIHEANSDLQKQALFDKVNAGTVRVIIGSTEKCGAGTNIQKRLVALHHLDTPYRPSDMQQREGRIIRQGNTNKKVQIYTYVTERTFDSYSYQILENKQRFISQINRGDLTIREADDIDETTLSYAEIKAITAANPKIKRKMELDTEVARLRVLEGQYKKNLYSLQDKVRKELPEQIRRQQLYLERVREDIALIKEHYTPEIFSVNVNGIVYTDKKEGGRALTDTLYASKCDTVIAEYGGFRISMNPLVLLTAERSVSLTGAGQYVIDIGTSPSGNLQRLDNFLTDFPSREVRALAKLEQLQKDLEVAKEQAEKPFEYKERLDELTKELVQINAELDLNRREEVIVDDNEKGEQYMGIPDKKTMEAEFIESTDKVAEMEVELLPDYTISQEDMHGYGYSWNGMLPMRQLTAARLYDLGLPVYALNGDDTEKSVNKRADIEMRDGLFAVEKPDWVEWLKTDQAREYLFARHAICEAAGKGVREEMDYMDECFTINFSESNYEEREALGNFLNYKKTPNAEKMKPYLGALLEEFTARIGGDHLEYYGWDYEDVTRMLEKKLSQNGLSVDKAPTRYEPVYLQTAQYAYEHGEIKQYRLSHRISEECKHAIDQAVRSNFDGMHLNTGFEKELIEKYGYERIAYICASTVVESEWDGRYSRENKAWAKTIPVSESEDERMSVHLNVHPAILDGFIDMIKSKKNEMKKENEVLEQDKYLTETKNGYKILSMVKDDLGRNIAIFQREKDFGIAAGYNPKDGTWAQGYYDFSTLQAAEDYRAEKYGHGGKPKRTWLKVNVARDAMIKSYEKHSFFRMPTSTPDYAGYTYNIFNNRIKESRQLVDLESDGRELCYELRVADDEEIVLHNKNKDEVILTGKAFAALVGGSSSKDYGYRQSVEDQRWITISVPQEAMLGMYESSSLFLMPKFTEQAGYSFYLPNNFLEEDKDSEDGRVIMRLPDNFKITVKDRASSDIVELTAYQLYKRMDGTIADDYTRERRAVEENTGNENTENGWSYVSISEKGKIAEYENRTLFRMPNGEYGGYVYYIPNKLLKENQEKGIIRMSLPEDFSVVLMKKDEDKELNLSVEEYIEAVKDKTDEDYQSVYRKPSEGGADKFTKYEELLRKNVPEEMKVKSNWIVVRTRMNEEKGRLDKFLISPVTGKFAESDNPETWTDFETACKYAHENGGETLAYALDGKDGIACIDLDGCMEVNGDFSETAHQVFNAAQGSYCEKSISGKGLHIFGKTKGADLRSFSRDKTMEYYQDTHFIAMTGDYYGCSELKSFDTSDMKNLLESKLEKRTEWKGAGKGMEGLSFMSDREVVEKACAAKYGDTFKALYEGQDLQNNRSNSDMSLMNRLAFWCNGDREQMLRIFATSGLYRPEKSTSYYEGTAIKAVRDTVSRFQTQVQNLPKPNVSSHSGKVGK